MFGKKGSEEEKQRLASDEKNKLSMNDDVYTASSNSSWGTDPSIFRSGDQNRSSLQPFEQEIQIPDFPLVNDDIPWDDFEDKHY